MKKILILACFGICLVTACWPGATPPPVTFATVTPSPEPTDTPLPPTPLPEDLSPYRRVMLPAFAAEVDRQAAAGISRYRIEATVLPQSMSDPAGPQIGGRMWVKYTNLETVSLSRIYFRLFPNMLGYGGQMAVSDVWVNGQPVSVTAEASVLAVPLPAELLPGQGVEVALTFQATVPLGAADGYGTYAFDGGVLTLAGFYPLIPVFDELGWHTETLPGFGDATCTDVSLYDVTITAPADWVIVTSGDMLSGVVNADGTQTIRAFSGPMRDFFVAMSADYQSLSEDVGGITVTSYFLPGNEEAGRGVLRVATQSLDIYNRLFGPYPYRALDMVAAPMPASLGGFEFPGVVVMAQRYYQQPLGQNEEFVTAHEVAHQWWYGLVGNDQVNQPWVDETLAQYSAVNYFEQRYGPEKRAELVNSYFWSVYNQLLTMGADQPVGAGVADFSAETYTAVVYGKGPLFWEAMRDSLGDARFFEGLRVYAQMYRYGVAAPDGLVAAFEQVGGEDANWLYRHWILNEF